MAPPLLGSAVGPHDDGDHSAANEFLIGDPIPHIRVRPFINPWGAGLFVLLLVLGVLALYLAAAHGGASSGSFSGA